jgi:hypothetical protein
VVYILYITVTQKSWPILWYYKTEINYILDSFLSQYISYFKRDSKETVWIQTKYLDVGTFTPADRTNEALTKVVYGHFTRYDTTTDYTILNPEIHSGGACTNNLRQGWNSLSEEIWPSHDWEILYCYGRRSNLRLEFKYTNVFKRR